MSSTATAENMLRLTSDLQNIRFVKPFVDRIASEHALEREGEVYHNILLTLTEAVNNAIRHGNQLDQRKKVLVKAQHSDRRLAILVEDEGCGFDYRKVPDPTKEDRLTQAGGRGVYIMHQYCDSVRFRRNGCAVELGFRL
jgi:serine/threonine-protein kinase RsbW